MLSRLKTLAPEAAAKMMGLQGVEDLWDFPAELTRSAPQLLPSQSTTRRVSRALTTQPRLRHSLSSLQHKAMIHKTRHLDWLGFYCCVCVCVESVNP